jgi:hypothetical protein
MPNFKIPAYRQAGKCQMNVKGQKEKFRHLSFRFDLSFEL